jgi:hypothetical protein
MTHVLKFGLALFFAAIVFVGVDVGDRSAPRGSLSLVTSAEAVVGRPLTPVSVAGVARRTVRRCAVGVYNC